MPCSKRKTSGLHREAIAVLSSRIHSVTYAARLQRRHGRLSSCSTCKVVLVSGLQVQGLCRQFVATAAGGPPQTIIVGFSGRHLDYANGHPYQDLLMGSKAAWLRISSHFCASCLEAKRKNLQNSEQHPLSLLQKQISANTFMSLRISPAAADLPKQNNWLKPVCY